LKNKISIGIDTSCYTTSIAAISLDREIIFNEKILLKVKENGKGLRQSEMVFQHVNNLGELSGRIREAMEKYEVVSICASEKPRPVDGSYMPAFTVGLNFARLYASLSGAEFYKTTHQENHKEAVLIGKKLRNEDRFLTVHISGGTTEIFLSDRGVHKIVGGSKDVSLGQLIDRFGVRLGYEFPCGKYIDKLAMSCDKKIEKGLKTSVKGGYMNLSGLENQVNREMKLCYLENKSDDIDMNIDENIDVNIDTKGIRSKDISDIDAYLAKLLMDTLTRNIYKSIVYIADEYKVDEVVFVGGVASSEYISSHIGKKLSLDRIDSYFSTPELSADNAVGCALIGVEKYLEEKRWKSEL
jgi:N6-L-threonylcarbamoyladenine synthase